MTMTNETSVEPTIEQTPEQSAEAHEPKYVWEVPAGLEGFIDYTVSDVPERYRHRVGRQMAYSYMAGGDAMVRESIATIEQSADTDITVATEFARAIMAGDKSQMAEHYRVSKTAELVGYYVIGLQLNRSKQQLINKRRA